MIAATLRAVVGTMVLAGFALAVSAQGPPPDGGFGERSPRPDRLMEGSFEFGGLMGGFGDKTVIGKPFQGTFTIKRTEILPGNSITNTTTGTVARDGDGDSYRDAKFPAIGPWASSGKAQEFAYIRNVTKGMQYIVNVAKGTYVAFPIREHNPPGGKNGPNGLATDNETVTDNANATYTDPVKNIVYQVDDRKVTRTIPAGQIGNQFDIVTTTERWYSPSMDLLLQETHSDPRFGTSTYQLSNIVQTTSSSLFTPDPSFTEVQGGRFGGNGNRGDGKLPPPVPPPQN